MAGSAAMRQFGPHIPPCPRWGSRATQRQELHNLANHLTIWKTLAAGCATLACAATPIIGSAQDAGQAFSAAAPIPTDAAILTGTDPNQRQPTAKVNGAIITGTDVAQRVALVIASAERAPSAEEVERLRAQTLRNLIDETLQIQEAAAQELTVDAAQVDQTYARVATQNFGSSTQELDAYLNSIGSSPASLKRQIQGQLAWDLLQRRNIRPFVNVSAEEVNSIIERLKESQGTEEYRIGEIYLAATPANREQVLQNAQAILQQLREGGSFQAYAVQYSQASTATVGGDLGWVRLEQLPASLASAAREMQPSQVAGPIEVSGGYSLMLLIDKRQILGSDPRDTVLGLKQISIGFPAGVSQEQATARLESFNAAVGRMTGCGDADAIAAEIGAEVVENEEVPVRNLPAQLQATLLDLQVGQATPPFGGIEEGVRVLMVCRKDAPQASGMPTFAQLQQQMEDERINQRAQRYLRDLRRDAVVEYN